MLQFGDLSKGAIVTPNQINQMNTEQNYSNHEQQATTSDVQPVKALSTKSKLINFPLSLNWIGQESGGIGTSNAYILLDALRSYKEAVSVWPDTPDRKATLESIEEMEHDLTFEAFKLLSELSCVA